MSVLEKLNKQRQLHKQNNAKMQNAAAWAVGKTLFTLLPLHSSKDDFYKPCGIHYIKDENQKLLGACGDKFTSYGEEDPVRNALLKLQLKASNEGRVSLAEHFKKAIAKQYFFANAVILKSDGHGGTSKEVKLVKFSPSMLDQLSAALELYLEEDEDALLRWNNRIVIMVERSGSGLTDTKYNFVISPKRVDIDPELLNQAVNLDDWVEAQMLDQPKVLSILSSLDSSIEVQPAQLTHNVNEFLSSSPKTSSSFDEDEFMPPSPVKSGASENIIDVENIDIDDEIPNFDNTPTSDEDLFAGL